MGGEWGKRLEAPERLFPFTLNPEETEGGPSVTSLPPSLPLQPLCWLAEASTVGG